MSKAMNVMKDQYALWFDETLRNHLTRLYGKTEYGWDTHLSDDTLLITFMFRRDRIVARKRANSESGVAPESLEFANVRHFYNLINREMFGCNYSRPKFKNRYPLVLGALDAEGSRYWNRMKDPTNIHVHSLWLLEPNQMPLFRTSVTKLECSEKFARFDFSQIDMRPVQNADLADSGSTRLSSYLVKFIAFNSKDATVQDDLLILPEGFMQDGSQSRLHLEQGTVSH